LDTVTSYISGRCLVRRIWRFLAGGRSFSFTDASGTGTRIAPSHPHPRTTGSSGSTNSKLTWSAIAGRKGPFENSVGTC